MADDLLCVCGHVFSNHRPLYSEARANEPVAWRCDESDGCMDFRAAPQGPLNYANACALLRKAEARPCR